jgi:hypothetical protein
MSLTRRMSEMIGDPFGLSAVGQRCFHCGEFLQDPAVMWDGADGQRIYFHGPCFSDWFPRLMRNALELKYHGKPCCNQLENDPRARVA